MAIVSLSVWVRPGRLRRALKPSGRDGVGALRRPRDGTEQDFNLDLIRSFVGYFDDLVESFLTECCFGLFKGPVVALDDCPPHRTLAILVALHASFECNIKKQQSRWHLVLPG